MSGAGLIGTVFYPCLRATIALVCASGEVTASVAMALGSFGAQQSICGFIGSAAAPLIYGATQSLGGSSSVGISSSDSGSGSGGGFEVAGWGAAVIYLISAALGLVAIVCMMLLPAPERMEQKAKARSEQHEALLQGSTAVPSQGPLQ